MLQCFNIKDKKPVLVPFTMGFTKLITRLLKEVKNKTADLYRCSIE